VGADGVCGTSGSEIQEPRADLEGEMANAPCIPVPSPQKIRDKLFPEGAIAPPSLPAAWTAKVLLTPFGGQKESRITPSDQLVVGNATYDASDPHERLMRIPPLSFRKSLITTISCFERRTGRPNGGG
jgi:hypothetical protein